MGGSSSRTALTRRQVLQAGGGVAVAASLARVGTAAQAAAPAATAAAAAGPAPGGAFGNPPATDIRTELGTMRTEFRSELHKVFGWNLAAFVSMAAVIVAAVRL